MANEFKIKNGFLSTGDSQVTGSLTVSNGITGSLFGTASWAENATSASYVSGSVVAPGSTTQVVFNNGGVLGADSGFVYSGSRVGIGTGTPLQKLHVNGNSVFGPGIPGESYIQIKPGRFNGNNQIIFNDFDGGINARGGFLELGTYYGQIRYGNYNWFYIGDTTNPYKFYIAPSTGNVVITNQNTQPTDAGYRLDVNGTTRVKGSGATSATTGLRVENVNASASLIVNDAGNVYNRGVGGIASNTFFGELAGNLTTGASNTLFGYQSGRYISTGLGNNAFGDGAGGNTNTGNYNCFFGFVSGQNNTSGANNTYIGVAAGQNTTTQSNNTFIGNAAGRYISGGANLTNAVNSTFLGTDTRASANGNTNEIVIGYQAVGLGSNTSVIGNTSTTLFRPYGNVAIGKNSANASLDVSGSATITGSINSILSTSNNIGFQQSESLRYSMGTQFVAGNYVALNNTSSVAHSVYSSSLSDLRIGVSAGTSSIPSLGANIPSQIVGFSLETGSNYSSIFAQRLDLSALGSGPANQAGILSVFNNNEQYELRTSSTDKSLSIRKYDTAGKYMQLSLKSASTGFEITNNLTSPSASLFSVFDNSGNPLLDVQQNNISLKPINIESTSDTIDFSVVGSSNGSGFILPLTQPPSPQPGSMYMDLAGPALKVWDGAAWLEFKPV